MIMPTLPKYKKFNCSIDLLGQTTARNIFRSPVKLEKFCRMSRNNRRGVAAVEFAIVAPVFFLLVLGMIEVGRMIMVKQIITNAAREGARYAVLDKTDGVGRSTSEVVSIVASYVASAKITSQTTKVYYSSDDGSTWTEASPDSAKNGYPIKVTVSVSVSSISWLPKMFYSDSSSTLQASSIMRRETVQN
jgi:Flp pilus assembly protein TadG